MLKIVGTALVAAGLIAGAAQAEEVIRKDVQVAYHDLDLASETGAKTLLVRIEKAANEACGNSPYFYSSYSVAPALASKQFAACRANAINSAVKSVKAPLVQNLYATNGSYTRMAAGL
ncbi:UrcA family protein [Rhizomicrobium palustre]|uniref:UrcA family protein n=1 Tax=Rhizomicrobium palustre TaxID=189966 RepID=A0A846MZH8_9PROT|nr:UrcA family protein [Rhizomicrobium palustre]NIK88846.1 UrcA family protein [Rhizomicrobium palustre]